MMKRPLKVLASLGHQEVDMGVEAAVELYAHGHREACQEIIRKAVEWYENRPDEEKKTKEYRTLLASVYYSSRQWEEAGKIFEELTVEDPESIEYKGYLGALAACRGDREGALRFFEELEKTNRPYLFGGQTYQRACIAALLGDRERAVALLKEAFSRLPFLASVSPGLRRTSARHTQTARCGPQNSASRSASGSP
ncbi:MAG TPA: tetratricopeptide repeat protein [Spirochaetia bacterium]|nr:tetratricopeptide repeat protein [Spirochaetia bacterium]